MEKKINFNTLDEIVFKNFIRILTDEFLESEL